MGGDLEEAPATRAAGAGDEKKADDEADDEEDEERGGAGFVGGVGGLRARERAREANTPLQSQGHSSWPVDGQLRSHRAHITTQGYQNDHFISKRPTHEHGRPLHEISNDV